MRKLRRIAVLVLAVILLAACSGQAKNSTDTFIRIDRDDPEAWTRELDNVRFLQEEGMSGSAQFSEAQLKDLAAQLKERSEEVWIVDCRLESHGLINGIDGLSANKPKGAFYAMMNIACQIGKSYKGQKIGYPAEACQTCE